MRAVSRGAGRQTAEVALMSPGHASISATSDVQRIEPQATVPISATSGVQLLHAQCTLDPVHHLARPEHDLLGQPPYESPTVVPQILLAFLLGHVRPGVRVLHR